MQMNNSTAPLCMGLERRAAFGSSLERPYPNRQTLGWKGMVSWNLGSYFSGRTEPFVLLGS